MRRGRDKEEGTKRKVERGRWGEGETEKEDDKWGVVRTSGERE